MFKSRIIYGPHIWNMDELGCPTVLTRATKNFWRKKQKCLYVFCIFPRKNMRSLDGKCAVDKATETGWRGIREVYGLFY